MFVPLSGYTHFDLSNVMGIAHQTESIPEQRHDSYNAGTVHFPIIPTLDPWQDIQVFLHLHRTVFQKITIA